MTRLAPLLVLILLAHCSAPLKGSTLVPDHGWTSRNFCSDVCSGPRGELKT